MVAGEVTRIDAARGTLTVREADGTMHEFQASADTLRDVTVGGRVNAKLREAPKCS
jgi:very-short-patch-repair endonuclease